MADRIKGSNLPFINLSKENLRLIYDALEAEQAGKMIFALTEYVYDGIEPNFETKIEKSVWNNILLLIDRKAESYFKKVIANRENGKKGGRPKKNNDIAPNEDFDNTLTTGLPTKAEEQQTDTKEETQQQNIDSSDNFDNYSEDLNDLQKSDFKAPTSHVNNTDDTNYQNTIESASEAKEMGNTGILQDTELIGTLKNEQFEVLNDNFDDYSERLYNLIDDNIDKIRQSTDILAQKQIELGPQMDNTVAFHRNVLYNLRKQLGWDTKDGIDFQQFIDEEINRKIAEIRYERAI